MFHEIHQQAIYGSDLWTIMFVAVSIVSYPVLNDMYNIFIYLFTLLLKRSVCHLLQRSPQYVKVLPLPWGKSTCGLLSPLISTWLLVKKWSIEAALLKWASSPELPLHATVKYNSTSLWPTVQLCLPAWEQRERAAPQGRWSGSRLGHGRHCYGDSNLISLSS